MTSTTASGASTLSLIVALASITPVGLGISLAIPLLSLTLQARGIEPGWIGVNAAAWALASMAATPFVPRLARRIGTGRLLALSILTGAACLPVFYFVEDFWLWFPLRFVSGAALATTFVLSEFWITAVAPQSRRGLVMGIYSTVLSIGIALGPAVLAVTGTAGALPFIVGGLIIAAAALPTIAAPVKSPAIGEPPRGAFIRTILIAPAATGAAFFFGMVEAGSFAILPIYGTHVGHAAESVILFAAAFTLGNVALQIPLGLYSDRFDRRRVLFACALVGALGATLMPFVIADLTAALIFLFVWGGLVGGIYTVGLAHLASRFASADLAAANSAFIFCNAAGGLIGPTALGLGIEVYDPHGFAVVLTAFFVGYLALLVVRMATAGRGQSPRASG